MRKVTKKMFTLSLIVGMCVCGASLYIDKLNKPKCVNLFVPYYFV